MDASASSQFISALLLAGARYDEGVTVHHDGKPVPSEPHILMTVETLRDAGAIVDDSEPNTWRVEPSEINALDVSVEPDLSNAGAVRRRRPRGGRHACGCPAGRSTRPRPATCCARSSTRWAPTCGSTAPASP